MIQDTLSQELDDFFGTLIGTLETQLTLDVLPGALSGADGLITGLVADLAATRDAVQVALADPALAAAIDALDPGDDAGRAGLLRDALAALGTVAVDPGAGSLVGFTLTDSAEADLAAVALSADLGLPGLGFDITGSADLSAVAAYAFGFDFDVASPGLDFDGLGAAEFSVTLEGDLTFDAEAQLGLLAVGIETIADPDPDLAVTFALDLADGGILGGGGATQSLTVSGGLDTAFRIATESLGLGILPSITTVVGVGLSIEETDVLGGGLPDVTPSLEFLDVGVRSDLLADLLGGWFGQIAGILDVFPLRPLIDLLNRDVPVLKEFTQIKQFSDLIELWSTGDNKIIEFLLALDTIADFITLLEGLSSDQGITLGSVGLDGATLQQLIDGGDVNFDDLIDVPFDLPGGGFLADFGTIDAVPGLELPFLTEGPQLLVQLLLNAILDDPDLDPITFIQYNIPALAYEASDEIAFRIFGPLVVTIGGGFRGGIDLNVGYSSKGIFGPDPSLVDGFFISTDEDGEGGFAPIAGISATVAAGLALDAVIARAGVEGGITAEIGINLAGQDNQGRTHLAELNLPCLFEDISGSLDAFLRAFIRIGIGPLAFERSRKFVDETLLQFEFDLCSGPNGQTNNEIENAGLASLINPPSGLMQLNIGADAALRTLPDGIGVDGDDNPLEQEIYRLSLAPPAPDGTERDGIAIQAFGIVEILGENDPIITITGAAGDGDDAILVEEPLGASFSVDGGAGDDVLFVGELADTVLGGAGNDSIIGGAGNDLIYGGDDNDIIDGGDGADLIFGGDGQDQVSYEASAEGVTFQVVQLGGGLVAFEGFGGDAEGDVLHEIEVLIGSAEDDVFFGNPDAANIIDAGRGDDQIYGGAEGDLLLGDDGADAIYGGGGLDQTSYILSEAGVFVDLSTGFALGGFAQGDHLDSIEGLEGTFYNDFLVSSGVDGFLSGGSGDDTLRSAGGSVSLFGGLGDDLVLADADGDGDLLDGGGFVNLLPGRDMLSYRNALDSVFVDLGAGTAGTPDDQTIDTITAGLLVDTAPGTFEEVLLPAPGYSTFEDLEGGGGNDTLIGDAAANSIIGGFGDDHLYGGDGDDTLRGDLAADALYGGDGADWADYGDAVFGVTVDLAAGVGTSGEANGDTYDSIENIRGTNFADSLTGSNADNRIAPLLSGIGIDDIDGLGGTDTLELRLGGQTTGLVFNQVDGEGFLTGATTLNFQNIDQVDLDATSLGDVVISNAVTDDIYHLRGGNDSVAAGGGRDVIRLGSGDDSLSHDGVDANGDLPPLWLEGEGGIDRLSIDLGLVTDDVVFAMGLPTQENPAQALVLDGTVAITGFEIIEDITSGIGNDILIQPGFVNNDFRTGLGDDFIAPGLGFDVVYGGDPDFLLETDVDILFLDFSTSVAERVTSVAFIDSLGNSGSYTGLNPGIDQVQYRDIERIFATGTDGDDVLTGALEFTTVYDGPGNILIGGAGNDTITGGFQADFLAGGGGGDTLYAGDGDDTLVGGVAGGDDVIDQLTGGTGADLFVLGDATGYFYGETSINPPDNRDGVVITDFDPTEGDVIQLVGAPSEYAVSEFAGATLLLRGTLGDPLIDAILLDFTGFDVNAGYVTYVAEAAPAFAPEPSLAETVADIAALLAEAGIAGPSAADLLALTNATTEAAVAEIRAGNLQGADVFAPFRLEEAPRAALADGETVLDVETTGTEAFVLEQIILEQIEGVLVPEGFANITVTPFGDPTGFGLLRQGFGVEGGVAISTGVVEQLDGPNLADGSAIDTFETEFLIPLEAVGNVGNADILRADVTGLDITQFTLIDANLLLGGTGALTGSDIDTVFFSTTEFSGDSTDFDTLPRLDVLDFSPLGVALDLGPQRSNSLSVEPHVGTFNGLLDNAVATLGSRDFDNSTFGAFSMGDGGEATFFLDQPLLGTEEPTYLYVAESGVTEGLYLQVANDPTQQVAGQVGDLSTDFGVAGPEGDLVGFDVTLDLSFDGVPQQLVEVELFQVVVAFESLLELAGADLEDRFRVTVNGFDALVLRDGSAAELGTLALSPNGVFHPDLIQNPVGTGPMADQLRADAFTAVLTVSAPIIVGASNDIRIEVEDRGDGLLDTAMFLLRPEIVDTLADTTSVFDNPGDTQPSGVFNALAAALATATNGARVRVGPDATPLDTEAAVISSEAMVIEADAALPVGLELAPGIIEVTLEGTGGVRLLANGDANTVSGSAGDDVIELGAGDDSATGGRGVDTLSFATFPDPSLVIGGAQFGVFVDLSLQGTAQSTGDGVDTFDGFENIEGSVFSDLLTGDDGDNGLFGGDGGDLLRGGSGNDTLEGGAGQDALDGGAGADAIFGGEGIADLVSYFNATGPLDFVFGESLTTFARGSSADVAEDQLGDDIEGIAGATSFANTFDASQVRGLTFLLGGKAGDTFEGGSGTDQLVGLDGDDLMRGNDGVDALTGGAGNDDLEGGQGADVFFFDGTDGDDIIRDLTIGEDLVFFTGTLITGLDQLSFSTVDGDGDRVVDDGLISYSAGGEDSSIVVVDIDGATLETTAGIFNLV